MYCWDAARIKKLMRFLTHYLYDEAMGRTINLRREGEGLGGSPPETSPRAGGGDYGPRREAVTAEGGTLSPLGERDPTSRRNERGPRLSRDVV